MTIRKAVAFVLIVLMSVTYTTPAFAVESTNGDVDQTVAVERDITIEGEESVDNSESDQWIDEEPFTLDKGVNAKALEKTEPDEYWHGITGKFNLGMAFQILDLVNEERSKRNKAPLTMDVELLDAAQIRAAEAAVYLVPSHNRPNGTSCFTVSPKANVENMAAGQKSAAGVMNSWMNSDGHRRNILDSDFESIGIGCFKGTKGEYYFTQVFSFYDADEEAPRQSGTEEKTILTDFGANPPVDFWIGEIKSDNLYVDTKKISGYAGKTRQLMVLAGSDAGGWQTYQVLDSDTVTWRSTDEAVATVDENGKMTFVEEGSCTVSANAGDVQRVNRGVSVKHSHNIIKVAKVAPTCTSKGMKAHYMCDKCGQLFKDSAGKKKTTAKKLEIKKLKHNYKKKIKEEKYLKSSATCTKKAVYYYACTMCEKKGKKTYTTGKALGHDYVPILIVKATMIKNGSIVKQCTRCGKKTKKKTIYMANNIKLNKTSVEYIGGGLEKDLITVTVKNKKKKTISSDNYTVYYSEPEYTSDKPGIGSGTVTVTFNEDCEKYTGSKTLTYKITNCPLE